MLKHTQLLAVVVLLITGCLGVNAQKQATTDRKQLFDYR